jgi:cAMP-binding proteins - catabolite gene activator and regulatory subunit of cAMP-dependent protein kinases
MKDFLKKHLIFKDFTASEIEKVASICTFNEYKRHDIIFCERHPSNQFFIIDKGKVKLEFGADKALEVTNGQVFGDWAMFNDTVRLATCKALVNTECIGLDYEKLKNPAVFPPDIALKIVLKLTKPIIGRLQTSSKTATQILISEGENQHVEFKESLRMNTYTKLKDDKIEFSAIKTIAGFLNSNGGVLFLGIKDDNSITGLEVDEFKNEDKLLLHLGHLVVSKLGKNAASYINEFIIYIDNKLVLRVDCAPSPDPVYLNEKKQQYFFVRQGAQTLSYNLKETVDYVQSHF